MGGKGEIINSENMAELYSEGCNYISEIMASAKNIEEKIAIFRNENLSGEKGIMCRHALNALAVTLNELSRSTEKAAVFVENKLGLSKFKDQDNGIQKDTRKKANYLGLKK